jgi:hypothetical protein
MVRRGRHQIGVIARHQLALHRLGLAPPADNLADVGERYLVLEIAAAVSSSSWPPAKRPEFRRGSLYINLSSVRSARRITKDGQVRVEMFDKPPTTSPACDIAIGSGNLPQRPDLSKLSNDRLAQLEAMFLQLEAETADVPSADIEAKAEEDQAPTEEDECLIPRAFAAARAALVRSDPVAVRTSLLPLPEPANSAAGSYLLRNVKVKAQIEKPLRKEIIE